MPNQPGVSIGRRCTHFVLPAPEKDAFPSQGNKFVHPGVDLGQTLVHLHQRVLQMMYAVIEEIIAREANASR